MVDSPDSPDAAGPDTGPGDEPRFPAARFFAAIAMLLGGGALMLAYIFLRAMSHNFNSRADDPWWYAGIGVQLLAGWLFLSVASSAREIPPTRRTWSVRSGVIVSYVLAAAILLFNVWAVATIMRLL
jgi:hypothetical protein